MEELDRIEDPFSCTVCTDVFPNDRQLKNHMNSHKVFFCHCKTVMLKNSVSSHTSSCSGKNIQTTFECDQCSFSSQHKKSLERHLKQHQEGKKSHVCEVCRSSFNTRKLLETHMSQKKHFHPHPCDQCEKQFISPEVRDTHVEKVHGPSRAKKTHSCPDCQKECRTPKELSTHMEVHTKKVRPEFFECQHCSHKTRKKSNLERHMKTRHGPRRPVIISSLKYWEIISRKLMSIRTALDLAKQLQDVIGKEHFETNLEATLRECLNQFQDDFEKQVVFWRNSKNEEIKSSLVWAKDLESIVARVILEKGITNPRIIFSFDGGNNKLIVCMTIIDLDNPDDSGSEFMSNGRRQTLVVARGDWAPENLYNWEIILAKLRLFDPEHFSRKFIVTGDLKVMNCFTGCKVFYQFIVKMSIKSIICE